jgi:hypothetical protein
LKGWPKAVLISPIGAIGGPRREDDVVAVGWGQLADRGMLAGLLAPVGLGS